MSMEKSMVVPLRLGRITSYLVRGDRPILIDTNFPNNGYHLIEKVKTEGVKPGDISLILITHAHKDHFGCAWEVKKETGAPIALHTGDLEAFRSGQGSPVRPTCLLGFIVKGLISIGADAPMQKKDPDIIFNGDLDLREYGVAGKVIHTPGHTRGSVSVILDSGEAIIGDTIMGGLIQYRNPGIPMFADNVKEVRRSIEKILSFSPSIIYATHGGPFDPDDVRRNFRITTEE